MFGWQVKLSALEVVYDDAVYKSLFTLLYFTFIYFVHGTHGGLMSLNDVLSLARRCSKISNGASSMAIG